AGLPLVDGRSAGLDRLLLDAEGPRRAEAPGDDPAPVSADVSRQESVPAGRAPGRDDDRRVVAPPPLDRLARDRDQVVPEEADPLDHDRARAAVVPGHVLLRDPRDRRARVPGDV